MCVILNLDLTNELKQRYSTVSVNTNLDLKNAIVVNKLCARLKREEVTVVFQ